MINAQLGVNKYCFDCYTDAEQARNMFDSFLGSQLEFEDCMNYSEIPFTIEHDLQEE